MTVHNGAKFKFGRETRDSHEQSLHDTVLDSHYDRYVSMEVFKMI